MYQHAVPVYIFRKTGTACTRSKFLCSARPMSTWPSVLRYHHHTFMRHRYHGKHTSKQSQTRPITDSFGKTPKKRPIPTFAKGARFEFWYRAFRGYWLCEWSRYGRIIKKEMRSTKISRWLKTRQCDISVPKFGRRTPELPNILKANNIYFWWRNHNIKFQSVKETQQFLRSKCRYAGRFSNGIRSR